MQCDDCLMYKADENYCRWFKMRATDFDFECKLLAMFKYEKTREEEED